MTWPLHIKDSSNILISRGLILASIECKMTINNMIPIHKYMWELSILSIHKLISYESILRTHKKICGSLFSFMTTMHHYFPSLVILYELSMQFDSMDSFFVYPREMSHVNLTLPFSIQWEKNWFKGLIWTAPF